MNGEIGPSQRDSKPKKSKKQDKPDFRGNSHRLRGCANNKHQQRIAHEKAQKSWDDYYAGRSNRHVNKRQGFIAGLRLSSRGHHTGQGKASIFNNRPAVPYLDSERKSHPPGGGRRECQRRAARISVQP